MAKKKSKSEREDNIRLFARLIELNVQMFRDITPFLFLPYSRIKWDKVKEYVKKAERDYESSLFD